MELLKPFAVNGEREDFSVDTDPDGKVSLDRGFTQLYELKPTEGGLFILRKIFNQMMYLVTNDAVKWKTQTFGDWIADKGDGTPYPYPKNAIVKYTDGNSYVSKVDNNTSLPTDTNNWVNFEDFGTININALPDKPTPVDTDNFALQEVGGDLKKVSYKNLLGNISITGTATLNGTTSNTIAMTGIVPSLKLEVGDVIRIQYSGYNKLHTVESITNDNSIIVNYEHAGNRGNGILRLPNKTEDVTITRIAKWYNASLGLGQALVNTYPYRTINAWIKNDTNRTITVQNSNGGGISQRISLADEYMNEYVPWVHYSDGAASSPAIAVPAGHYFKINAARSTAGYLNMELR